MPSTIARDLEYPELAASVRKYWYVVLVFVIVGAVAGLGFASQQEPVYESGTELLVADPFGVGAFRDFRQSLEPRRYVFNQAELAGSGRVAAAAAEILADGTSPIELRGRVTTDPEWEANLVRIVVTGPSADEARAATDAVARGYEQVVREDFLEQIDLQLAGLQAEREELEEELRTRQAELRATNDGTAPSDLVGQAQLSSLAEQISAVGVAARQLSIAADASEGGVAFREPAFLPAAPIRPKPGRLAAAGMLAALAAGVALAYLLNRRQFSRRDALQANRFLNAPLLGEVPQFSGDLGPVPVRSAPRSIVGEAYQFLVPAIDAVMPTHIGGGVILVTSAHALDGKTLTALNLAVAASQDQRDVLLLDADVRARGMTNLLSHDIGDDLGEVKSAAPANGERQWWLPELPTLSIRSIERTGGDPTAFFRTQGFMRRLGELRAAADLIIIDAPPLLAVVDAAEIAEHVDGVIVVTTPATEQTSLREIRRRLNLIGAPLIGYIVNKSRLKNSAYAYGYAVDDEGKQPRSVAKS